MSGKFCTPYHSNKKLTNLSIAYTVNLDHMLSVKNPARIDVDHKSDDYYVWNKDDLWRIVADETPKGQMTPGGHVDLDSDTYKCRNVGVHRQIAVEDIENQDQQIDLEEKAMEYCTKNTFLKDEYKFFQNLFTTGKWKGGTTGTDLVGGTDFEQFNVAGADPIKTVDLQKASMLEQTGMEPNLMMVDMQTFIELRASQSIKDSIKYTQKGFLTEDLLAEAFGVKYFWIAKSSRNKAAKGAAADNEFFAEQDTMFLGYIETSPDLDSPSAFYSFFWKKGLKNAKQGYRMKMGVGQRTWYEDDVDSIFVEGKIWTDHKVVAPDLGIFFTETIDRTP